MARYDYECADCKHVQEESHGMSETPKINCEACKSKNMSKQISGSAGIAFKGSGFYVNDYKKPT